MKKLLLFCSLTFLSFTSIAQITDETIEKVMTRHILDCDDIAYNAVNMIPRLYLENKTDTLNAVLGFWRRNCGMSEPLVTFEMLYAIEHNTFSEHIYKNKAEYAMDSNYIPNTDYYATNIISYLHWYSLGADIRRHPSAYSPDNVADYIVKDFGGYYDFLRTMAVSLSYKPGLTPVESFLVRFYTNPDTLHFQALGNDSLKGTVIQDAYFRLTRDRSKVKGFQLAFTSGVWEPQGPLAIIGNHPYLGFTIGSRENKFMYDFNFSIRFLNAPVKFGVTNNDTVYKTNNYTGFYVGADLGYELFRIKGNELDLLGGIGWDAVNVIFDNNTTNTYPSLNLNAGLGYKVFLSRAENNNAQVRTYIGAQVKYNFINYNNSGGTDFTGNAWTFGLFFGFYRQAFNYYYTPA